VHQALLPGISPGPALPDGFSYQTDFLSVDEEADVRARASELQFGEFRMRGFVAKRQVAYFGHDYAYDAREVQPGPPLPPFLLPLRDRAARLAGVAPEQLEMAAVIRYPPGAGIGWHRDAPAFGIVVGVSLGAPARLQLRKGGPGGERREVLLEPGSAYVLARAARWAWQHHLPPVRALRYAVTLRTMREPSRRTSAER
jgi:alkylated DNA repair dioxygenase AlkB